MKKLILACGIGLLAAAFTSCDNNSAESSADKSGLGDSLAVAFGRMQGVQLSQNIRTLPEAEKADFNVDNLLKGFKVTFYSDTTDMSYLSGLNMGMQFLGEVMQIERNSNVRIDRDKVYEAFAAAVKGDSITPDSLMHLQMEMQGLYGRLQQEMQKYQEERVMAQPETKQNIDAGKAFIAKAKKEDASIKTTESGLSYKVVNEGTGAKVSPTDRVKVNYVGKTAAGQEFDRSPEGEPRTFSPSQVIPGFGEGLQMMNKGAKYIFYIPGDIAYGIQGIPGKIGPMETLVFEVEVVDIVAPEAGAPGVPAPGSAQVIPVQ